MTYFENIKAYVGFTDDDSAVLAALSDPGESSLQAFADHFYECIARHPNAHKVLEGPEQVERLKNTLKQWMRSGLQGPHDEEFYARRTRIGRVHVQIGLPQEYMFTSMNVLRLDFHRLIREVHAGDRDLASKTHDALDKLYDLELAIMLQTYREDSEERMRRHERLATIGQIAGSIGHDLRNPLSVIQSSMYLLRKRSSGDPKVGRHLDRIDVQIDLCETIIRNLLELARNHPPRRERVEFERMFGQVVETVGVPPHITVELSIDPSTEFQADVGLLRQALTNLINNAVQAHGNGGGTIWVTVGSENNHIFIEVADDGPGFDAETITQVFEPLVTTRKTGTGLGLALVKGVTERHGGTVEAKNRPEGGAVVRIRLPKGPQGGTDQLP